MKDNLIDKFSRKQIVRLCKMHKLKTEGSRFVLKQELKSLSYSGLVDAYNYILKNN